MTLKSPELLLPAGSLDKMRAAYDFGADAIYAGQSSVTMKAQIVYETGELGVTERNLRIMEA